MTRLLAAFVLLCALALGACSAYEDPDPCDGPNGTCGQLPPCGEGDADCG